MRLEFLLKKGNSNATLFLFSKKLLSKTKDEKVKPQENANKNDNKSQNVEENSANDNGICTSKETNSQQNLKKSETQPCSKESVANDKKRKLSDNEFYTLLLSTNFFYSTLWAVKNWLSDFAYLSKLHSKDCVVEGIRMEYLHMGYGACINAFLKSMPFFRAWDFRMDWTHDSEFLAKGSLRANINLCNTLIFLLDTLFYAAFVFALFFIKRRRILKTGKLPKLGFIRKKIATMLSEE